MKAFSTCDKLILKYKKLEKKNKLDLSLKQKTEKLEKEKKVKDQ